MDSQEPMSTCDKENHLMGKSYQLHTKFMLHINHTTERTLSATVIYLLSVLTLALELWL